MSTPDYTLPGSFVLTKLFSNGSEKAVSSYNGNVVVLVNSQTQSKGEFTAMAFQSAPNVKVVGSQTAGADGTITGIILPCGIRTEMSALGVGQDVYSRSDQ